MKLCLAMIHVVTHGSGNRKFGEIGVMGLTEGEESMFSTGPGLLEV